MTFGDLLNSDPLDFKSLLRKIQTEKKKKVTWNKTIARVYQNLFNSIVNHMYT